MQDLDLGVGEMSKSDDRGRTSHDGIVSHERWRRSANES